MLPSALRQNAEDYFGSATDTDVCVRFILASDAARPTEVSKRSRRESGELIGKGVAGKDDEDEDDIVLFLGEPLPAHRFILRCGSERFRAYLERWEPLQQAGASAPGDGQQEEATRNSGDGKRSVADGGNGTSPTAVPAVPAAAAANPKKRPRARPAPANPYGLPELLIPLDSEDDVQPARRALRFMYSGSVSPSLGFKDILATRRLGGYLQIGRCAEACDGAMVAKLEAECGGDSAVVLDACACFGVFPDPRDEPSIRSVFSACGRHLPRHFCDAPSILNTDLHTPGSLFSQFRQLPWQAVEALLAADNFATDSESSVVLLLDHWIAERPYSHEGIIKRLCRLVRVLDLTPTFAKHILPSLEWFRAGAGTKESAVLAALAATPSSHDRQVVAESTHAYGVLDLGPGLGSLAKYDKEDEEKAADGEWECKWLAPPRLSCLGPSGVTWRWQVDREELRKTARAVLDNPDPNAQHYCRASMTRAPAAPQPPAGRAAGVGSAGGRAAVAGAAAEAAGTVAVAVGGGGEEQVGAVAAVPAAANATHLKQGYVTAHGLWFNVKIFMSRKSAPYFFLQARSACTDNPHYGAHVTDGTAPMRLTLQRPAAADGGPTAAARQRQFEVMAGLAYHIPLGRGVVLGFVADGEWERICAVAEAARTPLDVTAMLKPFEGFVGEDGAVRGELGFLPRPYYRMMGASSGVAMDTDDEEEEDSEEMEGEEVDNLEEVLREQLREAVRGRRQRQRARREQQQQQDVE